jgi:hypothetical protein
MDPLKYRAWEERMAKLRKACLACEQEAFLSNPNTDLEAVQTGVYQHGGEFCKKLKIPQIP